MDLVGGVAFHLRPAGPLSDKTIIWSRRARCRGRAGAVLHYRDGAMNLRPPQRLEGRNLHRPRAWQAMWCLSAGVILARAAVVCLGRDVVSAQQAIALALPGALLIVGGLIPAAAPGAATGRQFAFEAGFRMGWCLGRLCFRR
jgi:hypothetical protein